MRLDCALAAILLLDDPGQEIERAQAPGVEFDGAAEVFRCRVQAAPLPLDERGNELDAAVLGRQHARFLQPIGRLFRLKPLERDQAEVGPAGRLPGDEFGDALKRRRGQCALARLSGGHAPVEGRNGLRVDRRRGVGQIALARRSAQSESEHGRKMKRESQWEVAQGNGSC